MYRQLLLITLLFATSALAQSSKEKVRAMLEGASFSDRFDVGSNLMFDKVYQEALYVWEIMLEEDPTNANLNYKAGMCLVRLNREHDALSYFEKAQYAISKNYNPYSHLETHAPPEVSYYLAKSSHIHGLIDTAYHQYDYFLQNVKKKHERYSAAELGMTQVKVAQKMMADPKPFVIKNLGGIINTAAPEYSPVITIDGSALFFTSKRLRPDSSNSRYINIYNGQHYEDVYVSYRNRDGEWETPYYLDFCNIRKNDASISTSPDGQIVFVYQDVNGGDIYYSKLLDTAFSELEPFPAEGLNTDAWEPHITMSADGEYIFFTSDREGGMGGRDIYRIRKLPNGEWSLPFNLGPPINTEYDEDSPFIGADSRTLYFSSNGPRSMGGFDIFVSTMDEDQLWSEPENMGYPLNSVDDDIFYSTTADGKVGFYASEKLDGKGDKDIYLVQSEDSYIRNVAIFTGFILTPDHSVIPDGIEIFVTDLTDNTPPKEYSPRKRDGGYVLALKPCHTYKLDYQLKKQTFYETELYVPCNSAYQEINHELLLDWVNLEATPIVENLPVQEHRWEFENAEYFPQLEGKKVIVYEDKSVLYEDFINKHGQFAYRSLDPTKSHLLKIDDSDFAFCEKLVVNLVDSTNNVIDTYTFNDLCETNSSVQEFSTILTSPIFQYNFGYNKNEFNTKNEDLINYVKGVKEIIQAGKTVEVLITASASKVPTKKYHTNMALAVRRLDIGKTTLIKVFKANNIDMSKITFTDEKTLVGGPEYKNDAKENAAVYERYQYIKFEVRF